MTKPQFNQIKKLVVLATKFRDSICECCKPDNDKMMTHFGQAPIEPYHMPYCENITREIELAKSILLDKDNYDNKKRTSKRKR